MAEPTLLLSITMILCGFWIGWHSQEQRQARRWQSIFYIGCGLGLLAKGPVALVLAGFPIFCWCLPNKRLGTFWKRFPWLVGTLLTLIIALPWYIAAEIKTPGFLEYFIIGEHFYRYIESGWDGDLYGSAHIRPLGTIWIRLLQGGFPWSLVLIFIVGKQLWQRTKRQQTTEQQTKAQGTDTNQWEVFLWLWLLMPMVFFTFSKNLIWTYALPAAPPVALLLANYWQKHCADNIRWLLLTASISPLLMLVVAIAFSIGAGKPSQKSLIQGVRQTPIENPGEIIYWQRRPFSGRYYSEGKALLIKDPETLQDTLDNGKQDFLISRMGDFNQIPSNLSNNFVLKSQYRDWGYWLENIRNPDNN